MSDSPRFGTLAVDEDITRRLAPKPPVRRRCPRCHGEGRFNPGYPDPQTEVDCAWCLGDGEVPA